MSQSPAVQPFEDRAAEYDRWFVDSPVFAMELAALRAFATALPRPRLEIGVGPGRFAQALEIEYGIDPAHAPLQLAVRRGILVARGVGEKLPVRTATMGSVCLLFTFCFLPDPAAVFAECARVLLPGGRLLVGIIPRDSSWGKRLRERGRSGDPFYRHARFRSVAETQEMLATHGFQVFASRSTLQYAPGKQLQAEVPVAGALENAGFCVMLAGRQGEQP